MKRLSTEEFAILVEDLFSIDDSDTKALSDKMESILSAIAGDVSLKDMFLQRTLPIIIDVAEKKEPKREHLLDLVLAYVFGFLVSKEHIIPNDVVVSDPPGEASGTVVLVLGWAGSNMQQLDDVEQFYRDLLPASCIVRLLSTAAININLKGSASLRCDILAAMNAALKTWDSKTQPKLLVHLFSNGGTITWLELLQCWHWLSCKEERDPLLFGPVPPLDTVLKGIILDSAPSCSYGSATIDESMQGLLLNVVPYLHKMLCDDHDGSEAGRKQAEAKAVKVRSIAMDAERSPLAKFLRTKPERIVTTAGNVEAKNLHRLEPPVPLQFIYSKKDSVIPYEAVERYIEDVNKRPNRQNVMLPFKLLFEDSKHIFHKVLHKETYWHRVKVFASNVLKN